MRLSRGGWPENGGVCGDGSGVNMVMVAAAVMVVAGMTAAAGGYEVEGGDVDDGGVVVVRGMVMVMRVVLWWAAMMKLNKTSIHSRRKKRVLLIMDLELAKKMSLEAHQERVERRGEVSDMGNEILGLSLDPAFSATSGQGKAIVTERTSSSVRLDQILSNEEKIYRPRVMHILYQYLKNAHEDLAGPDPKPMQEDQTRSDSGKVHMSLAGPKPGHYG
ncbi:hypothetical protein Tco_0859569 [Tanacetum coccineum]|uniref:Uncharacterized protein n=1 Tax=Tanacetum coccineum TaxID=301880 RepID=A0ABQ5BEK1_9ASTR